MVRTTAYTGALLNDLQGSSKRLQGAKGEAMRSLAVDNADDHTAKYNAALFKLIRSDGGNLHISSNNPAKLQASFRIRSVEMIDITNMSDNRDQGTLYSSIYDVTRPIILRSKTRNVGDTELSDDVLLDFKFDFLVTTNVCVK